MQVGRAFFVVLDQKCGRCHATHGRLTEADTTLGLF